MKSSLTFSLLVLLMAIFSPFIIGQTVSLVGSIGGAIGVNSTGAATYTVPIEVVPGTNGITPNISIAYNSQSGIGLLGANWQLEGLSSIRRIPQNLYLDNNITCVNLDISDRFSLDGNRLIDVTGTYGADGTKYKTEIETFREIKSKGSSYGGPAYFEVADDNGTKYEFGNTIDSKQMLGLVPLAWYVNKITDCEGNYVTFKYYQGLGQIVVSEINYTGNEGAALLPYAKITFRYNDNIPNNTGYIRGQSFVRSKLLEAISTYYMGTLVKNYTFTYDYTRVPRLTNITLTGENDKQINPTVVEWSPSVSDTTSYVTDVEGLGYFPLRYDGDKCTDFFYCKPSTKSTSNSYEWRIISNDCQGNLGQDLFGFIDNYQFGFPADVNGDGSDEVVYAVMESGNILSLHYLQFDVDDFTFEEVDMNLTFFNNTLSQMLPGDLNGDGRDEIIFYTPTKSPKLTFWGLNDGVVHNEIVLASQELKVQDNNNNRKAEIMIDFGASTTIYEYDNITKRFKFYVSDPIVQMGNYYNYFGDFNDDGLKDVLRISKSGSGNNHTCFVNINVNSNSSMWSSFGTLMPLEITFNSSTNFISTPPLIGDMNGDKRDDIVVTVKQPDNKIRLDVFYSDGYMNNQFQYHKVSYIVNSFSAPNFIDQNNYYCTDMNGDGSSDVLYVKSYARKIILFFHKDEQFELLRSVVNGYGAKDSLNYVMSYSPYTYYTSNFESRIYFPLVSKLYSSNGLGNNATLNSFEYYDVLYSLNRSKFLGFSTVKSTNHANGLILSDSYSINTIFDNVNLVNRSYYQSGYTLKETFTPTYLNWGKIFLSYNDIYEKSDFITGVRTNTNTDAYADGRIQNIFTRNFRIDKDIFLSSSNIAYQYQDIVLPNTLTVKKLKSSILDEKITGSTESLQYTTTYNYSSGRLNNIVNSNNSSSFITSYTSYNSFGNPNLITKSATDVASQTEQIGYDVTGRFVTSLTNAMGHISSSTYYGGIGQINTSTDANGLITRYFYDELGRERLVQYPDGTSVNITRQWRPQTTFLPNIVYSVNNTATASPQKVVFYDKLGREVFIYVEGIGYKQTVYNAKGQIEKESLPYILLNTPENSKIWTSYLYDPQGRISTETGPYLSKSYTYDGINSDKTNYTVTDLLRHTSVKKSYDLPDRIVQVEEDAGGTITYGYEFKKIDSKISKVQTINYTNNKVTLVFDLNDNLKSFNDANSGTISSIFDAFNRIVSKTDAKSNQTTYLYDLLDRVTEENHSGGSESALKFEYKYDIGSNKSKGKLFSKTINVAVDEIYYYDDLSRVRTRKKMTNNSLSIESFGYNSIGQLYTYTFPDGFQVRYAYNNFGELSSIYDNSNNALICAIARNNFRKHSSLTFGNQTGIKYLYNSYGMLTDISSGDIEIDPLQNGTSGDVINNSIEGSLSSIGDQYRALKYTYDAKGLIERREDPRVNQYETYVYDKLDRLTSYTSGTIQPLSANSVTYGINSLGNITSNTLVGNYGYGAKPYAVEQIYPNTSCSISHSTCSTPFNNRNLPASITEGIYSYTIDYGSDGNRRSAVLTKTENGSTTTVKTTRYISPSCEIEITPSGTKFIDYIFTDQGVAAIRTKVGTQLNMYYVHTDHLGSFNFAMDAGKNIVQSCHFDPWGNRKLYNNWSQNNTATGFLFSRGFTSHEHLDVFKIINMNARLYDPVIGRFFSPDPVIKDYEATQSYNRYSYCQNNPVNRVDLDGMKDDMWDDWVERKDGSVYWNDNVTSAYDKDLQKGETYRGKAYRRFEHILTTTYNDVYYNPDETITSTLRQRPDFDGVVTNNEAVDWYHYGGGNPLTVNISQFRFKSSDLSVEDFTHRGRNALSVNFFNAGDIHFFNSNILYRPASDETLSDVYGTIRLALVNVNTGEIRVVTRPNGSFDTYDFSRLASIFANSLRSNGNPKPFEFFGKGTGTIRLTAPIPCEIDYRPFYDFK